MCNQIKKRNVNNIIIPTASLNVSPFLASYIERNIKKLRISHDQIYDVVSAINRNYGLPILFVLCWKLTLVISTVYTAIDLLSMSWMEFGYCTQITVIFIILPMICHSAVNEFQNGKILVQKMILHNTYGSAVNKELKLLLSQLTSMKIEYSACGFFYLNLPFLGSVVGVILSYIVVLSQFK